MTSITLINPRTQEHKEVPIGFSWTFFFFTFLVPFIRGDVKWGLISLLVGVLTFGVGSLVLCFMYNKIYIKGLLAEGFQGFDSNAKQLLQQFQT